MNKKTPEWIFKTLFFIAVGGTLLGTLAVGGVVWYFSRGLPKIITVADYRPLGVTRVFAKADSPEKPDVLIGEYFKERRYVVPFERFPEPVVNAFISAEDDQFFAHSGINIASIIRASIANFRAGQVVQGGSTITQQVAKSLVLTSERSFVRKIKEAIVASRIEKNLTKQQILYLYLNQIYLGHGAYGVQAAAQTYFRKNVEDLTVAEAALLAGLPQAPGKYSPWLNPKRAKERQLYVLKQMHVNKFISSTDMMKSSAELLRIYHDEDINKKYAAYWVEHLRRYLLEKYGEKVLYEGAMTVLMPSSLEVMTAARTSLRQGLEGIDKRSGYRGPLATLKNKNEMESLLKEVRAALIEEEVGFKVLVPEGRLDTTEALTMAGVDNEYKLLKSGKRYRGVVTSLNDKEKLAGVMVGGALVELPLEKMKWAKPAVGAPTVRGEPSWVSSVLKKGDVILVRVEELTASGAIVSLDQEPEVQGALFSLDATTGFVLAMEGGYDFGHSEFNRAIQAQRQPGSAFKPIIYSAGLEKGFTPASIIVDSPIVYDDVDTGKWKPANFDERFYGDTTFRQALIKSRNVPTIKLVQAIGVQNFIEYTKRLGIRAQLPVDLSISLGSGSVSLVDLTRAYALYPRFGRAVEPLYFLKILDREGAVLEENNPQPFALQSMQRLAQEIAAKAKEPVYPEGQEAIAENGEVPTPVASVNPFLGVEAYPLRDDPEQVLDPRIAYVMTHLMKEVVAYGTGHEAKNLGRPAAGKTGTTNEFSDAWFMGFTPQVVTGVWVGFDGQKTLDRGETGARASLPIWVNFMKEAVKQFPADDFVVPPGVVFASIDPQSGKLAAPNASNAIKEAFLEGTEPIEQATPSGRVVRDAGGNTDYFKEDIE